jgi:hypothetical protein
MSPLPAKLLPQSLSQAAASALCAQIEGMHTAALRLQPTDFLAMFEV